MDREEEMPLDDTPDHCHACGAPPDKLRYDVVFGWCCLACGGTDADERYYA